MKPKIALIAAVARNGIIGADNALPWRLSTDLKRFKRLTLGKPVVMGRKTFASLGKPLAGRTNVVITRQPEFAASGVTVVRGLAEAFAAAGEVDEIMVIGGGEIFREALALSDRLYITHVAADPAGDTLFPPIDPAVWRVVEEEEVPVGPKDDTATRFALYERRPIPRG